jgi:hypothetical protein
MMSGEAWLYLFAVLVNAVNLFLQVFFTIMYSDLEWSVSIPVKPLRARDLSVPSSRFAQEMAGKVDNNPNLANQRTAITSTPSTSATDLTRILSPKPVFTLS